MSVLDKGRIAIIAAGICTGRDVEQSGSRAKRPVPSTAAPLGCWHLNTCIKTVWYLLP